MHLRHYHARWLPVRLGGVALGKLHLGGGTYYVAPLDVEDGLKFVELVRQTAGTLSITAAESLEMLSKSPAMILRPFLPMLIRGHVVKRRWPPRLWGLMATARGPLRDQHLNRATDAQVVAAFGAALKVNDFAYCLERTEPREDGKPMPYPVLIDRVATSHPCYTHADVLRMPFEEVLEIVEAMEWAVEDVEGKREAPLDDRDRALIRARLRN